MTHAVEHLCIYFIIDNNRCLLRSLAHFLIVLLLSFKSSLYVLLNNPLPDIFCKYVSLSLGLSSHSLDVVFRKTEDFILMKSSLLISSFMPCVFGVVYKKVTAICKVI